MQRRKQMSADNFHIRTVHLDTIRVFFIYQLMHKRIVLKTILKFTLKLTLKKLKHVSVQSSSSGSVLFDLAKVTTHPHAAYISLTLKYFEVNLMMATSGRNM
jgi:hypothetical protein